MIDVREATREDIKPFHDFCRLIWPIISPDLVRGTAEESLAHFYTLRDQLDGRTVIVSDNGVIVAGLACFPTTRPLNWPDKAIKDTSVDGYEIAHWVIDTTRPDRIKLADTVAHYMITKFSIPDRRYLVVGKAPEYVTASIRYGTDFFGMKAYVRQHYTLLIADAREILERLYGRHPEWR